MLTTTEMDIRSHRYCTVVESSRSCPPLQLTQSLLDIDDKSLQYAQANVDRNNLKSRVKILKTTPDGPLLPWDSLGVERSYPLSRGF